MPHRAKLGAAVTSALVVMPAMMAVIPAIAVMHAMMVVMPTIAMMPAIAMMPIAVMHAIAVMAVIPLTVGVVLRIHNWRRLGQRRAYDAPCPTASAEPASGKAAPAARARAKASFRNIARSFSLSVF